MLVLVLVGLSLEGGDYTNLRGHIVPYSCCP